MNAAVQLALTALALVACLGLLWRYITRGLLRSAGPSTAPQQDSRIAWYRRKAVEQGLVMLAAPLAALALTGHLALAFQPGAAVAPFAYEILIRTGLTGEAFALQYDWKPLLGLIVLIVALELVPVLRGKGKSFMLGNVGALLPRNMAEARWTAVLALNAGIGEELLFRAFIPLALATLGVPIVWGFVFSCIVFAACHTYQGWVGVIATGALGLVLCAAYATTYSLVTAIILHILIDVMGLVVRPLVGVGLRQIADRVRKG